MDEDFVPQPNEVLKIYTREYYLHELPGVFHLCAFENRVMPFSSAKCSISYWYRYHIHINIHRFHIMTMKLVYSAFKSNLLIIFTYSRIFKLKPPKWSNQELLLTNLGHYQLEEHCFKVCAVNAYGGGLGERMYRWC